MDRIYLSSPHIDPLAYHQQVLMIGEDNPLSVENIFLFEKKIQDIYGLGVYATALNSGTSAIHLALLALGVGVGDEVICQSLTFIASVNPIVYLGAIPVFVDSELDTWNMCPIALEKAIKDRMIKGKLPKAIIVVDLYGMPFKYYEIRKIANKYAIPIIEDSAEAFGSSYEKKKCGLLGDIGILSFNINKIITTGGGGGVITKSKKIANKVLFLATQARENTIYYQHEVIGYNYRINPLAASLGCLEINNLNKYIELRKRNHQYYLDFFKDIFTVKMLVEPSECFYSNHWLSAVVLESYEQREALRLAFEKANIETRPLWKPMHLQPIFKSYPYYGARISEDLFERGLCLPSGSNLTESEKERILSELQLFFR
ncbi:DegT/DnrJ/EryC1/StrS family aminotransferase [Flavobacterium columnare]|uniref:Aminotransferase n=1 Tax=Flavobacterium columnare (strain ATCC 49512 / CIP 103533 / TG 44/87) TaxID=1041826 RepID=G8X9V5_FLACA|nr:DegT/DnrJ/EryC1/StrS family aminotransferase [Flavobacterium columnare]AEW87303.1 aminotransferase [Flavobacterium columnare ATCC 49512]